jgi:hypothetical protein
MIVWRYSEHVTLWHIASNITSTVMVAQPVKFGYHFISSARTPQFLGNPGLATVSDESPVGDLVQSIIDKGDQRLKEVSPDRITIWKLKTPLKFPDTKQKISELAKRLQFFDDELPVEQVNADGPICEEITVLFKIKKGQAYEWSWEKVCLLFQVSDGECSLCPLIPSYWPLAAGAGAISSDHKFRMFDGCFDTDAQIAAVLNSEMAQKYAQLFMKVRAKDRLQLSDFGSNNLHEVVSGVPEFVKELEAVLNKKRFLPPNVRGSVDLCQPYGIIYTQVMQMSDSETVNRAINPYYEEANRDSQNSQEAERCAKMPEGIQVLLLGYAQWNNIWESGSMREPTVYAMFVYAIHLHIQEKAGKVKSTLSQ